ncbi:MAG: DUF4186 family protein [Thermodesulfobacteriota bacterium]
MALKDLPPDNVKELTTLNVKCTDSRCEDDLHCYRKSRNMKIADQGKCRKCGIDLIDWKRVHQREVKDVEHSFTMLKTELIRHVFWHTPIDQRAINHARRKGRQKLREAAQNRLWKYVANEENFREGRQTPRQGNIIYYAQHATACCCRRCMEYWHDIPVGIKLSQNQVEYFLELIMLYVKDRLSDLKEESVHVPALRNS